MRKWTVALFIDYLKTVKVCSCEFGVGNPEVILVSKVGLYNYQLGRTLCLLVQTIAPVGVMTGSGEKAGMLYSAGPVAQACKELACVNDIQKEVKSMAIYFWRIHLFLHKTGSVLLEEGSGSRITTVSLLDFHP